PSDRRAIGRGKAISILAFRVLGELIALPASGSSFRPAGAALIAGVALADLGIAAVGTLLAAMAAASRARELLLPLLFLPLAIPIVVGGVGASVTSDPGRYLGLLGLYDALFAIMCWASFECVVTEQPPSGACDGRPDTDGDGDRADLLLRAARRGRPQPEDLLLPRADRLHGLRVLRLGRLESVAPPVEARRERRPRELRRDSPRRHLRRAHAHHRLDLGALPLGPLVGVEGGPARPLPRAVPLLLRVFHAALLAAAGPAAREPERGLRPFRRRLDPGQRARDPALAAVHPPGRIQRARDEHGRLAVLHVLRRARRDADLGGDDVQHRAGRQTARCAVA